VARVSGAWAVHRMPRPFTSPAPERDLVTQSAHSRLFRVRRLLTSALLAIPLLRPAAAAAQDRGRHEALEWSGAAVVFAGALLLDGPARGTLSTRADTTIPRAAYLADVLGRPTTYLPVLAGMLGTGLATGDRDVSRGAVNTAAALLVAEAGTRGLKFAVGRARPDTPGSDGDEFRLLTRNGEWSSFPSGHATTAFAMAAAVDHHTHDGWTTALAYGAATAVGWARVRENRHWTSDVVAGALVGSFLSEVTLRWLDTADAGDSGGSVPLTLQFSVPTH
jgi:membrane-associated phospholipid phosphatase